MKNKMSQDQINYHASFIRTQTKKKRTCVKCLKPFSSRSAGHRVCNTCDAKTTTYGAMAEM